MILNKTCPMTNRMCSDNCAWFVKSCNKCAIVCVAMHLKSIASKNKAPADVCTTDESKEI